MFGRCDGTVSVPDKLFACEGIRYRGTALDRGDVMVLVMGLECDHWGQQPPPHHRSFCRAAPGRPKTSTERRTRMQGKAEQQKGARMKNSK
ncbi:hypothetical protein CesoFtcFv8_007104 [Champsocephalus esox]|uniref:Uncharacterized protein n=1 Tax=Champsocephalus esox TaxID=159716 RepID=A0AAN8H6Y1_9TELE|nr:hypothetical protein CesoFtcFv8_007104 [Champsocephalus esox]